MTMHKQQIYLYTVLCTSMYMDTYYIYICVYIYIYICMYTHMYIYTHIHTYIYTHSILCLGFVFSPKYGLGKGKGKIYCLQFWRVWLRNFPTRSLWPWSCHYATTLPLEPCMRMCSYYFILSYYVPLNLWTMSLKLCFFLLAPVCKNVAQLMQDMA